MPVIPALWEAEAGWSLEFRSFRPAWTTWQNPVSTKHTKISWAWLCVPMVPATQEAGVGGLLEPRRLMLRWAVITPLHSSLGNRARKKKDRLRTSVWIRYTALSSLSFEHPVLTRVALSPRHTNWGQMNLSKQSGPRNAPRHRNPDSKLSKMRFIAFHAAWSPCKGD